MTDQASKQDRSRKRGYNAENGAMFFARLAPKCPIDFTAHPVIADILQPGSILEIDGPVETGKTSILIDIAAYCILPKAVGGLELNVAFIDCERQFHIDRLITMVERALRPARIASTAPTIDEIEVTDSLARFHYVACDCSDELLEAFDLLDGAIGAARVTHASGGWILLIDGINAFYWLDRTSKSWTDVNQMQQKYATRANRFVTEHNLPAITTKLIIEGGDNDQEADREGKSDKEMSPKIAASSLMEYSWRKLIKHSVQLSVTEVGGKKIFRACHDNGKKAKFVIGEEGIAYLG